MKVFLVVLGFCAVAHADFVDWGMTNQEPANGYGQSPKYEGGQQYGGYQEPENYKRPGGYNGRDDYKGPDDYKSHNDYKGNDYKESYEEEGYDGYSGSSSENYEGYNKKNSYAYKNCPRLRKSEITGDLNTDVKTFEPTIRYYKNRFGECVAYVECIGHSTSKVNVIGSTTPVLLLDDYQKDNGAILEWQAKNIAQAVLQYKQKNYVGYDLYQSFDKKIKVVGCLEFPENFSGEVAAGT